MIPSSSGRVLTALLAVTFCGIIAATPARADDSFLNYMLPWVFGEPEKGPKPQDTLQAPFGTEKPVIVTKNQADLQKIFDAERSTQTNMNELNLPHRSPEQVGEWITSISTQALTIEPSTFDKKSKAYTGFFLPYALQEYQAYLANNQILETLRGNHMRLTAFAESKPILIQEGVLEGTYRWLYRVPIMLTYYDLKTTTLKDGKKAPSQTQRVMVNIQVGRASVKQAAEGMAIERWSVSLAQ